MPNRLLQTVPHCLTVGVEFPSRRREVRRTIGSALLLSLAGKSFRRPDERNGGSRTWRPALFGSEFCMSFVRCSLARQSQSISRIDWRRLPFRREPADILIEVELRTLGTYRFHVVVLCLLGERMSGRVSNLELSAMLSLGAICGSAFSIVGSEPRSDPRFVAPPFGNAAWIGSTRYALAPIGKAHPGSRFAPRPQWSARGGGSRPCVP
jgi:hypothetical protein